MRYLILVLLNVPIILIALLNIITRYKLGKASARRFRRQLLLWLVILIILIGSFPIYNLLSGRPVLDSRTLSFFDIAEVTVIIFLFYVVNNLIRKLDQTERRLRDLHQEISIKLSEK